MQHPPTSALTMTATRSVMNGIAKCTLRIHHNPPRVASQSRHCNKHNVTDINKHLLNITLAVTSAYTHPFDSDRVTSTSTSLVDDGLVHVDALGRQSPLKFSSSIAHQGSQLWRGE